MPKYEQIDSVLILKLQASWVESITWKCYELKY
jgi:hypothetical protein